MVLPSPVLDIVCGFLQSLGCTIDCMCNPYCLWICTIHTCAKWLLYKISTSMRLPVHNECPRHKHYRTRVLPTQTVLVTHDRHFSKFGTYSSHSCFRNIPLFKTALKNISRKDEYAQENTGSFAILIFPSLN